MGVSVSTVSAQFSSFIMWKFWIIVVAFTAQNIVPSDADYPCVRLKGECVKRTDRCCPYRMTDGAYYCADETYACCLDYPKTFHYHPGSGGGGTGSSTGGSGGGTIGGSTLNECERHGGKCVPTANDCNCTYVDPDPSKCPKGGVCCADYPCGTRHVDGMCLVKRFYAIEGNPGEQWTPLFQIPDGCYGKKVMRDPDCPGKSHGCIRHKILNLLECLQYACPSVPPKAPRLSVSELIAPPDLCDGKGVIVEIPDRCHDNAAIKNKLKKMCEDVGGTAIFTSNPTGNYLKCICYE